MWAIMREGFVRFDNVVKRYQMGEIEVNAADGITFDINEGEFVVVTGPSGAGKTTVLNILGGMDRCDGGKVIVDGIDIGAMTAHQLVGYRRNDVGFVFQFYNLVQNLTALENVELAAQICRGRGGTKAMDAQEALRNVGLEHRMRNFPAQLSGGEQQRVSIARALAKNPKLLLCDEPTGALDDTTGRSVLELLHKTSHAAGMTVVMITHNSAIAPVADRIIKVRNGKIKSITRNDNPLPIEQVEW